MRTKRTVLVSILIIVLMTSTAFAGNFYSTKNMDKNEIEGVTNSFFTEKEQSFLSNSDFNIAKYYSAIEAKNIKKGSSVKLFEYEKQMRDDNSADISNEKFEYTINSITITGDKATAKCYEQYEYTYKNDPVRSSRGIEYQITFVKKDNKWEIVDITTNNELERLVAQTGDVSGKYIFDFDIDEEVEEETNNSGSAKVVSAVTHDYNRTNAAEYALQYSDSTHTNSATSAYNSKFPQFAPNDCQNFVSQCVWAGLGGSNTSTAISNKNKPMITTTGRKWFCSSASSYTTSWTVVGDFRDYVVPEADGEDGIYGVRYLKGKIANAQKGDVVQICDSNGTWYHSYIISSVTGTYGSRTLSNINICAHTSNRRNENLANVIGASSTNFRLIRISGTRY